MPRPPDVQPKPRAFAPITREQARKETADQAKADALERVAYAVILRNRFLDLGADVKVSVSGAKRDHITLRWIMFNDVWTHRIRKPDGIAMDMVKLGFRRVDITDGYDYHVYFDINRDTD